MRKLEFAAVMVALLTAPAAFAQESGVEGHSNHTIDLSILPKGCQDAIQQSEMSGMMHDMDMSGMDEAQEAPMPAIMEMNRRDDGHPPTPSRTLILLFTVG